MMTNLIELDTFLVRALEQRERNRTGTARAKRPVATALDLANRCDAEIIVKNCLHPAYHHDTDVITIPQAPFRFVQRPKLLSTIILHELVHWSGAPARMNRSRFVKRFDISYNGEELVAEIGAVLLSFDLGITRRPILPNHKYLADYLTTIDRPDVALHVALGQAEQAAAFIHMTGKDG